MVAAFAALIYELDGANHVVQAFDFGEPITASSTRSDANGLTSAPAGFANFGGTAVYNGAFAFEFAKGDTIATGVSELHVGNAHPEDGGSDREIPISPGFGSVDVVAAAASQASHRSLTQTGPDNGSDQDRTQSDLRASDNAKHEAVGDDLNHGQSQKALHESENISGAAKAHAKHEAAGDDLNHGQSQKALRESDNSSEVTKGHAKHEAAGDDVNHGQSQKPLHVSDNSSGVTKGHAKYNAAGDDSNHGQSQKVLYVPDNGSGAGKGHAKHDAAGDDLNHDRSQKAAREPGSSVADKGHAKHEVPSSGYAEQAKSAVGTKLGDSFHFKNGAKDTSADKYDLQQLSHGNEIIYAHGQHAVGGEGPEPVQDAHGFDISDAHHDHSGHASPYTVHDLIV
jgi:hypothetical protein